MRIAVVSDTYPPQVNGVARTLARTADAMRSRGHEVLVLTTSDPGAVDDPKVHRFRSRAFKLYPQLQAALPGRRAVARVFQQWKPDLVHVATPFGVGLAGRAAARRLGIPLVSSYHTSFSQYTAYYGLSMLAAPGWAFLRWFHNSTRLTLCPTHVIRDELIAHGFRNVALWTRGIDTRVFSPDFRSDSLRASWGAGHETTVITYVGRLAAEKGLDVALATMQELIAERDDVVFVVVGDGPYAAYCRQHAPKHTVFTGQITGRPLSETYASSDVFLFPSTTETFGNVALEAMASGLVVVGADVPQTREVVPSDCGVFFPAGDAKSLADALRALLCERDETKARRVAAVAAAAARSWDAVFDQLESDYLAAASKVKPTSRESSAPSSLSSSSPSATRPSGA